MSNLADRKPGGGICRSNAKVDVLSLHTWWQHKITARGTGVMEKNAKASWMTPSLLYHSIILLLHITHNVNTHNMNHGVQRWELFEGAGTRLRPFICWTLSYCYPLFLLEAKDHDFCVSIAKKINSESEFPVECMQYIDAVSLFKMRSNSNPYAGMSPAEAIDAKRAKSEGHLNSAQIKRRMTTKKNGRFF